MLGKHRARVSFLGDLIALAEADAAGHLDRFLGAFDGLTAATVDALTAVGDARSTGPERAGSQRTSTAPRCAGRPRSTS